MFGALFLKECKQILKSLVYYIYIVVMVLFLTSQLTDEEWSAELTEPQPGMEYYGTTESHDEDAVMNETIKQLLKEYNWGHYATYPFSFYKEVILSEAENEEIRAKIEYLTGQTIEQLIDAEIAHFERFNQETAEEYMEAYNTYEVKHAAGITYQEFETIMKEVSQMIGKGSYYEGDLRERGVSALMSYEDAVVEYQAFCELDKGTGAYMRLFCDYAGIMLLIMPIFIGATRALRDKRAQAAQVIYARGISSAKLVLSRYLANVVLTFIPVVVLAFLIQAPFAYQMKARGMTADYFAFIKYSVVWLLPGIMITLALAFLFAEIFENVFGVIIQIIIQFASLFSATTLVGDFGLKMEIRWNNLGETVKFFEQRQDFLLNRGFYTILALLLVVFTVFIYEKKRGEGVSLYAKVFKNRR